MLENTNIWIGNRIAHQITLLAEAFFEPVQASKDGHSSTRNLFWFVTRAAKFTAVEISVDDNIQRIDIGTQFLRINIWCIRGDKNL